MPKKADLQYLAHLRIKEAKVLWSNDLCNGAFYLTGYSIELALKAVICRNLEIDELFGDKAFTRKTKEIETVFDKFKIHDLDVLIVLAGLYQKLQDKNDAIFNSWSIISYMKWSELCRYNPEGRKWRNRVELDKKIVNDFITETENFLIWIQQYW